VDYKTMDAKFRGIASQILRLNVKQQPVLVGTRSIEMTEKVSTRLTAENLQKLILAEMLLDKYTNEKSFPRDAKKDAEGTFKTAIEDLKLSHLKDVMRLASLPVDPVSTEATDWFLTKHGLTGEDTRERLKEALEHGVAHNVLNAKYHEREALIISEAGRKGAITIATNMAGRGVDILLGGRVADDVINRDRAQEEEDGGLASEYADTFLSFRRGGKERAAPPLPLNDTERRAAADEVRELGGLFILGTERHESRRIDNQLRGRSGRQGDPGASQFFVSLEDMLWKVFNSKMMENPLLKAWPDQEVVNNRMITNMIKSTQERIENHFFEARKHTLEYDDVLNAQREHIYGMRREILLGKDCRADLKGGIADYIGEIVDGGWFQDEEGQGYASDEVYEKLNEMFPLIDSVTLEEFEAIEPGPQLRDFCVDKAMHAYDNKVAAVGDEVMKSLEQHVMLRAVNDRWMEHLQMIDYIREGIGLRGYGQVDPLVAYKKETFDLFQHTLRAIRNEAVKLVFQAQISIEDGPIPEDVDAFLQLEAMVEKDEGAPLPVNIDEIDWKRVGRNDPCPCGSGRKFKACHYTTLREQGII
jgi:preprotein translocase subunit SecA